MLLVHDIAMRVLCNYHRNTDSHSEGSNQEVVRAHLGMIQDYSGGLLQVAHPDHS